MIVSLRAQYRDICPNCSYEDSQIKSCEECETVICGCCENVHEHLDKFDLDDNIGNTGNDE